MSDTVASDSALDRASAIFSELVELRRALHQIPELAFEEEKTADVVTEHLDSLGIPYHYDGVGSGIVAELNFGDDGDPTVALRAELDGLPAHEMTGLPFASEHEGKMHACGHDVHMTNVLGAARLLKNNPPERGNVRLVFQPAEETGAGSKTVLDSGHLDGTDAIFAGHVSRHYEVGEVMIRDGIMTAHSDRFHIDITGQGGHGARPHKGIDAVVIAGALINSLQTLVSREVRPVHPSVVTIGEVEAGTAPNIIAETAHLSGSIRSTRPDVRQQLHDGIRRMAGALAEVHGAQIDVDIRSGYPPIVNAERETDIVRRVADNLVGEKNIRVDDYPSLGSEDFAYYLDQMPGCYFRFGARGKDEEFISLHSPSFTVNEETIRYATAFFDQIARKAIETLA